MKNKTKKFNAKAMRLLFITITIEVFSLIMTKIQVLIFSDQTMRLSINPFLTLYLNKVKYLSENC